MRPQSQSSASTFAFSTIACSCTLLTAILLICAGALRHPLRPTFALIAAHQHGTHANHGVGATSWGKCTPISDNFILASPMETVSHGQDFYECHYSIMSYSIDVTLGLDASAGQSSFYPAVWSISRITIMMTAISGLMLVFANLRQIQSPSKVSPQLWTCLSVGLTSTSIWMTVSYEFVCGLIVRSIEKAQYVRSSGAIGSTFWLTLLAAITMEVTFIYSTMIALESVTAKSCEPDEEKQDVPFIVIGDLKSEC